VEITYPANGPVLIGFYSSTTFLADLGCSLMFFCSFIGFLSSRAYLGGAILIYLYSDSSSFLEEAVKLSCLALLMSSS
jgi:hypothetical protein